MHKKLIHLTLAAGALCFALEQAHGVLPAPVAHWSFDGSGLDSSGNNHATRYGNAAYVPGLHAQAARFDGLGDYFQVANNPVVQLRSAQQFSVTAYVKPAGLTQQVILGHGRMSTSRPNWSLSIQGDMPYPNVPLHPGCFVFSTRGSIAVEPGVTPTTTPAGPPVSATGKALAGQWAHVAATYDGATLKLYVDGVLQSGVAAPLPFDSKEDLYIGGDPGGSASSSGRSWYAGLVDDVCIFDRALTADEITEAMQGVVQPQLAGSPSPMPGATDVARDPTLRWMAGNSAAMHDVYLGKSFADVDGAGRAKPMGVLVSQGRAETAYRLPAVLDFGQTYYWRVDEVGRTPNDAIQKGSVWGFTVEPYTYPIPGASITATASGSISGCGPENTVNGSGMNGDLHGTDDYTMWRNTAVLPQWIQYQFDRVYTLDELLVWNYNSTTEFVFGTGAKTVKVEYSTDGVAWTALTNVAQFAMARGQPSYAANTTIDFGDAAAKYVKLTISDSWGGRRDTGLSEVRFSHIPLQARFPSPPCDAAGQSLDTLLNWRPGRNAGSHTVYFSTDADAVADGTAVPRTATDHAFDPGTLNYGTTYCWKVDEVGAGVAYPGEVWNFTTREFAVVDDFESYNDTDHLLSDAWIGGQTDGQDGSATGHSDAPYAERTIVHRGKQSLPLAYDISKPPFRSETTRDLGAAQDWTDRGATHVDLWFRGDPGNAPASMRLIVTDKAGRSTMAVHPDPSATVAADWTEWQIPLSDLSGVSLTTVQKITLRVSDKTNPQVNGAGVLYIDDIGFGHPADLPVQAHTPQPADGAADQSLTTTLSWKPGRDAASHAVFFGTDRNAVVDGTAPVQTVAGSAFDPGTLNYGTTYYWRVDEINAVTCPGDVWSFTTREFAVVDDFESYNDEDYRIFDIWYDSLNGGASNSLVGYMEAPFTEQTIVHGGRQSMPLAYDNSKSPFYSETARYLGGSQDWASHGVTHLNLWFHGNAANAPASLYLIVANSAGQGKIVVHPNPTATVVEDWTEWRIPLSDLTGVNLAAVWKVTLGVGDKANPQTGGAGLLYLDDIGYGHPAQ